MNLVKTKQKIAKGYLATMLFAFFVGSFPMILNIVVDPFELRGVFDRGLEKKRISEKAHYPLWKITHYPKSTSKVVIIGDSRARALQDQYWRELDRQDVYNFAYGGVTLHEIYDTFRYVRDNSEILETLVIGIQLRSFDPDHKQQMNRVPEAVRLANNPVDYYSSWFVSGIGYKILEQSYGTELQKGIASLPKFSASAHAKTPARTNTGKLKNLLEPEICESCILPKRVSAQIHFSSRPTMVRHHYDEAGLWGQLWGQIKIQRELPDRHARQIRKNAISDWRSFEFSERFWNKMVEISAWCQENDVALVFVIPPTIVEMQEVLHNYGHGELNHNFRIRLARLGLVVDFDFRSDLTRSIENFKDAYHFNSKVAKLIVGEISLLLEDMEAKHSRSGNLARHRRKHIVCPIDKTNTTRTLADENIEITEGLSCRIWRQYEEGNRDER